MIDELRQRYSLEDLLELTGIARSTHYYYRNQEDTDKYQEIKSKISEIFSKNKSRYGYRRITQALKEKGYTINHKTVLKLMKSLGLKGKQRKNDRYHSYKGEVGRIADNLLKRDFYASKPYEKLTTDVTQFKVCNEKVYLSPIMDLYNREIVSYSISLSPNLQQVRDILNGLFASCLPIQRRYFILIKAGSISTQNISDY